MAVNVINPNKGRVYLSKEGLQLDSANLDKYHPNSNVNTLQVNIEDGGVLNTMAMINYQTPSMAVQSQAMTSHWYPLFFIGINNVKVRNESGRRTFAQFLTPIPVNILNLNLGRSTPMNVKATVKLVGGVNFKGVFDSLGELQAQLPPTLELDEEYAIACVIDELGNVDYYQVDETSTDIYEWVKNSETTNPILSLLESKQYNIFNISVQGGFGNATPLPLATQHYQILWQAINNQGNAISDLDNKVDNVISSYQNTIQSVLETNTVKPTITNDFPNGKRLELDVKVSVGNDLIEVESDGLAVKNEKVDERIDLKTNPIIQDLNEHIEDLNNPHGVTAEQVGTYDKATIDNKDADTLQEAKDYTYSQVEIDSKDTAIMNKVNNLENANMFKDVNYNNVNGVLTFTKYDNTTKQIDLPLELIVTSGYYDEVANELVLVLANGSEIRIPVGNLLTDLDAHNIRFNGSGTNYLVNKQDVESAVKELDTEVALRVKTSDIVDNVTSTDTNKPLSAKQGKVLQDTKADKTYVDAQDQILDDRIDTIIAGTVEGVSGAEIVDARKGKSLLGDKIEEIDKKFELQNWELQNKTRKPQALVTFTSDDGMIGDINKLRPIFESEGVPLVLAVISGNHNIPIETLKDVQDNLGWEIASHSVNHTNHLSLTDEQLDYELKESRDYFRSNGLNCNNYCIPFGQYDDRVQRFVRKYYRGARCSDTGINISPLETFALKSVIIAEDLVPENNTAGYYKSKIDEAIASGGWVIFLMHGYMPVMDETQLGYLQETIQYAKSLSVPIVTIDEGLNRIGNIVDVGLYKKSNPGGRHFVVGADGTTSHGDNLVIQSAINEFNGANLIDDFPNTRITITQVTTSNAGSLPESKPGLLITNKLRADRGYAYQEYNIYQSNDIYIRYCNPDNTWGEWSLLNAVTKLNADQVSILTPISGFPNNKISYCRIGTANANTNGSPSNTAGLLMTNRLEPNGWTYQEFHPYNSVDIYKRNCNDSGVWSAWMKVSMVAL